jgi:Protein of unknown function (DUF2968)
MTMKASTYATVLAACLTLAAAGSGQAAAARTKSAPKPDTAATAPAPINQPDPAAISGATADELRRLTDEHALSELRRTVNGSYTASLMFDADKLIYYVVLSHNAEYWRVIRTDVVAEAERVYRTFTEQTERLAQVDIDTIRLEAGRKYGEHLLTINQARLAKLREDAAHRDQQAQQVATMQQQARQQATTLTGELRSTRGELEQIQQNIRSLEARQADPLLDLPSAAPAPVVPASTAPAQ